MKTSALSAGTVHGTVSKDLRVVLEADETVLMLWEDITPLARNEWICWVESAKLVDTRQRRIARVAEELLQGMRRPCCWAGCIHRVKNGV